MTPPPGALITRPVAGAEALAAAVAAAGFIPILAPLLEIVPHLPVVFPDTTGVQALLFTSATAVRLFAQAVPVRTLPAYTVGDATAAAAALAGFASVISAHGDGATLARLAAARLDPAHGRVVHVSGEHLAFDACAALARQGFTTERRVLYASRPVSSLPEEAVRALLAGEVAAVLFFSARTATTFAKLVAGTPLVPACKACVALGLSQAVCAPVAHLPWTSILSPSTPTTEFLLALLQTQRRE
jgi:uroporphyrinogen-III synthase